MKQTINIFLHITFISILFCLFSVLSAFNFRPKFFSGPSFRNSQLYSVNVGLENVTGHIGYFGDFDSDRYTDVFIISPNKKRVDTYRWNTDVWRFEMMEDANIDVTSLEITIDGIIAADFNNDGKLDLLVEGRADNNSQMMRLILYLGNYTHFIYFIELLPAKDEVLVFDWNGDLRPDLLGTSYDQNNTQSRQRVVWENIGGAFQLYNFGDNVTTFATPNSNAFVDLNGDCISDLFLAVEGPNGVTNYEIWLNQGTSFTFHQQLTGIPGAGQLSFADFDGDGNIDILVPICVGVNCSIQSEIKILYNSQMSLCVGFGATNCRKDTNLCIADPSFSLPNFDSTDTSVVITLPTSTLTDSVLSMNPSFPWLTIRIGDYNLDGYPDLLVPVRNPKDGTTSIQLWMNVECSNNRPECTKAAIQAHRRTFSLVVTGVDALNIPGGFAAAFFDFDEDGTNDLFVLSEANGIRNIHAVYNNFDNDAYFLKTLSLNGLCLSWCPGDIIPNPKPYGVNQHGAMFKWTATDLANVPRTSTAGHLIQSSYLALQTPYVFWGLGRPSNYVDYLWVGLPSGRRSVQRSVQFWPGIIPNSQVVIIPYPPEFPDEWSAELYINPGGALLWITLAVVGALIVIGIIVWILTCQEKRQDAKAKRETEHLFSFKAM